MILTMGWMVCYCSLVLGAVCGMKFDNNLTAATQLSGLQNTSDNFAENVFNIIKSTDSKSYKFDQGIQDVSVDILGQLLQGVRNIDGARNLHQDIFPNALVQTALNHILQNNNFGVFMKSLVLGILDGDILDQNMTDNLIEVYNTSGMVTFLIETLPLVRKVRQLLRPTALTTIDVCPADMAALLQGLTSRRLWAMKMIDASGKPGKSILKGDLHFLGNYDECYEIKATVTNGSDQRLIRGQYWSLGFTIPSGFTKTIYPVEDALKPPGKVMLQWDVCLPRSCKREEIIDLISELPLSPLGIGISDAIVVTKKDWKKDGSAIAAIVIIVLLASLTVVGTVYDVISGWLRMDQSETSVHEAHTNGAFVGDGHNIRHVNIGISMIAMNELRSSFYPPEVDSDEDELNSDNEDKDSHSGKGRDEDRSTSKGSLQEGFGRQLLLSFSLSKNTEKILNTSTGDSNLGCIHGIRVLSMAWVILGHTFTSSRTTKYENPIDFLEILKAFTTQSILAGTLAVDTFFLMSGCLVCYLFLKETKKSGKGKPSISQMVIYYIHRYWRLTPVYMFIVMFYTCLMPHIVDGPMITEKLLDSMYKCRQNWWINLLYINNLYKANDMCAGWSWYLANDMQFYFIAPLALLPLAYGFSVVGIVITMLMFVVSVVTTATLDRQLDGATTAINRNKDFFVNIYSAPWCRVGLFAIGIIIGYILYKTKCKAKIPNYVLVVGWQIGLVICLSCTFVTYDAMKDGIQTWPVVPAVIYETLFRPAWGVFVSWVIFVCCTGHGGVVNSLLSWDAWVPLGRLTYGAYLVHPLLLSYTEFTVRTLAYFNIINFSYDFIGTIVVSYALSFITCVLVESPCMGLEKAVLKKLGMKK